MPGFEVFDSPEALETVETPSVSELREKCEQLRLQANSASEAGNLEKANYFQREFVKLNAQLEQLDDTEEASDAMLGEGYASHHSETYWKKQAAKEFAEHGKTPWYYTCKKRLEEAIKNDLK